MKGHVFLECWYCQFTLQRRLHSLCFHCDWEQFFTSSRRWILPNMFIFVLTLISLWIEQFIFLCFFKILFSFWFFLCVCWPLVFLFFLCFFFLVRKIGPELTSVANLPLFIFSPKSQYTAVYYSCECLWLCCVGHRLSMAWRVVRSMPRIWTGKTPGCWSRVREPNHWAMGLAPIFLYQWHLYPILKNLLVLELLFLSVKGFCILRKLVIYLSFALKISFLVCHLLFILCDCFLLCKYLIFM